MDQYFKKGKAIIDRLENLGFKAFFVGGYVRDRILGIDANDIDITTDAVPNEVEAAFENTKPTGKKYGTISVFIDEMQYEVTTFRADIKYIDFRHPERVVFSKNLEDDLKRRDFTINALAMDGEENITDMFSGKEDLENGLIRAIGDPNVRFTEDALRVLRAFRFVSKLDFDIEENTLLSIKKNIDLLQRISNERIIYEIKEIFRYDYYAKAIKLMGLVSIENAFPELRAGIKYLGTISDFKLDYITFFVLCLHLAQTDLPNYWRFSNKETEKIRGIRTLLIDIERKSLDKMAIYRFGNELSVLANDIAVILGISKDKRQDIETTYDNLPIKSLGEIEFKGDDVIDLIKGRKKKVIGEILENIEREIVEGRLINNYNNIKKYVKEILESKDEE